MVADYDSDEELEQKIENYYNAYDYGLVWINLDVEDVYLGKKSLTITKNL